MRKIYSIVFLFSAVLLQGTQEMWAQETAFRKHVGYLASDTLKGRLAGASADSLIVGYIRTTLQSYGYQPLLADGLQRFPIIKRDTSKVARDTAWTYNVVMALEGRDKKLKNEYIVFGAHYDHLGMGGKGSGSRRPDTVAVHYGADDNASGVAMLLELAKKIAASKPKRSVLIVAFGAEEQGIVGSKYFVQHLPEKITKPVMMFNFDMVGRLNDKRTLEINGTGTFAGAETVIKSVPNPDSLHFTLVAGGYGPSDHTAFYADSIPVLFFTTGVHYDYHLPADKSDKINYSGMEQVFDYTYYVAEKILNTTASPVYQKAGSERETKPHAFKITFGIIPDFNNVYEGDGMRADFVTAGKPADKAGMKNGDVILLVGARPVHNIEDYMKCLSELTPGQSVTVRVQRGNDLLDLVIEL